jgi:hypothetical protein
MLYRIGPLLLAAAWLSACNSSGPVGPVAAIPAPASPPPQAAPVRDYGAVLGSDGRCTQSWSSRAAAIEPGIAECDLPALKGKPATDVLVGQGRLGEREVQVLYSEPGGRELYFFVDNKLTRTVKPGA